MPSPAPASRTGPPDLPAWLIRLARQIARDCHEPGTYVITVTVPYHRKSGREITIARLERMRRFDAR